jgi:hypothetical protein
MFHPLDDIAWTYCTRSRMYNDIPIVHIGMHARLFNTCSMLKHMMRKMSYSCLTLFLGYATPPTAFANKIFTRSPLS